MKRFNLLLVLGTLCFVSCNKGGETPVKTADTTPVVNTIKYIDTLPDNTPMLHPGGLIMQADIDRAKANYLTTDPWKSDWSKLIANSHAQLTYNAHPTVKLIRGGNSREEPDPDNYSNAMNDVAAAWQLGIRWKISGDATYAQAAVNILNAWASTCVKVSGDPNAALAIGIYGYEFACAGELLRDYPGWQPADFAKYQQWMLTVFYPAARSFLNHSECNAVYVWSNWDLCQLACVMSIGILTEQRTLYNYCIDYIQKNGRGNGMIFRTIPYVYANQGLAQMQESGRDQGHATLSLALLTTVCQIAWNQGDDLWGFNDNMVLKASEYIAKYNVAHLDVPYTTYNWVTGDPWALCDGTTVPQTVVAAGYENGRPMYALIYNHYVKLKGLTATYTTMGMNTNFPEGGGGDYGPNSGGFDQLGFGTLLYSR